MSPTATSAIGAATAPAMTTNMGYSIGSCPRSHVQRVVVTHITRPDRFDNARQMPPNSENRFLSDLNGRRHATTAEMLRQIGAE